MKYLASAKLIKTCLVVSILYTVSGCSATGDSYTMYGELPTYQPNDALLSCEDISTEISLINTAMGDMGNSIVELGGSEKSLGTMSAFSYIPDITSALGTIRGQGSSTFIPMAPSLLNQDVIEMKRVSKTFQKRKDFLIHKSYAQLCMS